jgi:MFS family permease
MAASPGSLSIANRLPQLASLRTQIAILLRLQLLSATSRGRGKAALHVDRKPAPFFKIPLEQMNQTTTVYPIKDPPANYEVKAVVLLGLGFGLLALDRWSIATLFPFISKDLNLNYQDLGNLTGVLAIAWGITAIITGRVADRLGRRKVLLPAIIGFSLMAGLSGLATGFLTLYLMRLLMGVFEGGYTPVSIAATTEASKPERRGLNIGVQLGCFALIGLGFGPIIVTQLFNLVHSWRGVFVIVAVPGLIVAYLMYRTIREPPHLAPGHSTSSETTKAYAWSAIFQHRNVIVGTLALVGAMSCIFVVGAIMPSYLIDYLKLSPGDMGFVTSAIGFFGAAGQISMGGISDRIGRRLALNLSFGLGIIFLLLLTRTGADKMLLFFLLGGLSACAFAILGLLSGPVVTEAVPAALMASVAGIPTGVAEIFGGGVMPSIAGFVAQHFGIQHTLTVGLFGLIGGLILSFFVKETAPRFVGADLQART